MSGGKKGMYRPRNVPMATFDMFGSATNVRLPASATAAVIQNPEIRSLFMSMSKRETIKINSLESLIELIPNVENHDEFMLIVTPAIAVFDTNLNNFNPKIRSLSVNLIEVICTMLKREIVDYAQKIFPTLLLYTADTDPSVNEVARNLFNHYFPTPEKRNGIISKIRRDICIRIKYAIEDLKDMEKHLSNNDEIENWGRLASATINISTNVVNVCRQAPEVFTSISDPAIFRWVKPKDSMFLPQASAPFRAAVYVYMLLVTQADIMMPESSLIIELIKCESSVKCQERLLKLVTVLLNKQTIEPEQVRNALSKVLQLYYAPEKCGLQAVLEKVADISFLESGIKQASLMNDINSASALFNCLLSVSQSKPELNVTKECMFDLLKSALSDKPKTRFLSTIDLSIFTSLKSDPLLKEVLENGSEQRCVQFIKHLGDDFLESWIRSKQSINAETVLKIIDEIGTQTLRKVWPGFLNIPLQEEGRGQAIADLVLKYARTEEIPSVLRKYPKSAAAIMMGWTGDFSCFRCDEFREMVPELLEKDIMLYRFIKAIFSDDAGVQEIMHSRVKEILENDDEINPLLFEFYEPDDELKTDFLMSSNVDILESGDKMTELLLKHIPSIMSKVNQVKIAGQAFRVIEATQVDPKSIVVSPVEAPTFCFEFWQRCGFDNMNDIDFCFLLNALVASRMPWLPCYLYIQNVDWRFVPSKLWDFVSGRPKLAAVAIEHNTMYALAAICAATDMKFGSSDAPENCGPLMAALSLQEPPSDAAGDRLAQVIQSEWNHTHAERPDFSANAGRSVLLRQTIAFLIRELSTLGAFDDILEYVQRTLEDCDHFEFFLCLRILSLLRDTDMRFDPVPIGRLVVKQAEAKAPLPGPIDAEFGDAFRIMQYATPNNVVDFLSEIGPSFSTAAAKTLAKHTVSILRFFNLWDLLETRLNGRLDLAKPSSWHLVSRALMAMPYQKRIDIIPSFERDLRPLLDETGIGSEEFLMLVTAFPTTAMKWSTTLPNSKLHPLMAQFSKSGTARVFESVARTIKRLKLDGTVISTNARNLSIAAVYQEDSSSTPVRIELKLPDVYPFKHVQIACDFGNGQLAKRCEFEVAGAIVSRQSVDAGLLTWHRFIIAEMQEKEPCTICYSYLDDGQKVPKVKCATCGQRFHGSCLAKWFAHCLQPTCPYCACPWKPKG